MSQIYINKISIINFCNKIIIHRFKNTIIDYSVQAFVSKFAGIAFQKVDALMKTDKRPQYPVKIGWNVFSSWACKLENENCTKMALDYFRRWRNDEEYNRIHNIILTAALLNI